MTVNDLLTVFSPPQSPLELPSDADWARCSLRFGKLPPDYRTFVDTFGTGVVDGFLWIFNPGSANPNLELEASVERELGVLEQIKKQSPNAYRMSVFPQPGGYFPFGGSDNGDTLFWVTDGAAEDWTVAVMGPREREVFEYAGTMTGFLIDVLERRVVCDRFPEDFPDPTPHTFESMLG